MIYANFKKYDYNGNRLAIFGVPILGIGKMEIFVLKCSKKDQFNKNLAWQVYASPNHNLNGKQYHPMMYKIDINEEFPKKTFIEYIKTNFYSKVRYTFRTRSNSRINTQSIKSNKNFINLITLEKI